MSAFTIGEEPTIQSVRTGCHSLPQVDDKITPHQKAQWGADVRPEPLPGTEPVLPERWRFRDDLCPKRRPQHSRTT
jgi:hypothetical protein